MNTKTILYWFGGILTTFIVLFLTYKLVASPKITEVPEINQVKATDNAKWSKENKNILVEYSDLQCPACKSFHDVIKTFEASNSPNFDITKKVTLVFRHFPLSSIHPNAMTASYAAEAAAMQGKFFEMIDALFTKQSEWSGLPNPNDYYSIVAKSIGLDVEKFNQDINSQFVKNKVQNDLNEANSIGLNSTPTFFLNGKKVEVSTFDEFTNLLKSL